VTNSCSSSLCSSDGLGCLCSRQRATRFACSNPSLGIPLSHLLHIARAGTTVQVGVTDNERGEAAERTWPVLKNSRQQLTAAFSLTP